MLVAHLERHATDRRSADPRCGPPSSGCVDYLCEFWQRTMLRLVGGARRRRPRLHPRVDRSRACAPSPRRGLARRRARPSGSRATAQRSSSTSSSDGVVDGHLVKTIGRDDRVDASLIAAFVPFGTFDPHRRPRRRRRTTRSSPTSPPTASTATSATPTSAADDGSCSPGSSARSRPSPDAPTTPGDVWRGCATADRRRAAPRTDDRSSASTHAFIDEWVERWGPVATPLLWSHAMYITLADELGDERAMTTDVDTAPLGSGHPYRIDPDQRHPIHPIVGESVEIRVTDTPTSTASTSRSSAPTRSTTIAMRRADPDDLYAGSGHQRRPPRGRERRTTRHRRRRRLRRTTFDRAGRTAFRYRFRHDRRQSPTGSTRTGASWSDTGGDLRTRRNRRADPVEVRLAGRSPTARCAVASCCRSTPDDHVVGFGERFHALDQRGHRLDARVFEQYKQQGIRTYLPSPFAVVAAGAVPDGWGFHVDTSRVTDVRRRPYHTGTNWSSTVDVDPDRPDGRPPPLLRQPPRR